MEIPILSQDDFAKISLFNILKFDQMKIYEFYSIVLNGGQKLKIN